MRVVKIAATAALLSLSFGSFAEENNDAPVAQTAVQTNSSFSYLYGDLFTGSTDIDVSASLSGFSASASDTLDRRGFRLGIGSKSANGIGFDVFFEGENVEDFDNSVIGFGGSVRKVFLQPGEFQPFIKLGIGFGSTELEDGDGITFPDESTQSFVSVFAGIGVEKRLNDEVELHAGFDFGSRSWDDILITDGFNTVTVEQEDKPKSIYIGLKSKF